MSSLDLSIPLLLVLTGALGLSAMTWLFPVIAWGVRIIQNLTSKGDVCSTAGKTDGRTCLPRTGDISSNGHSTPLKVGILLPVFNEADKLRNSLVSISNAIARAEESRCISCDILVGIDGCSDHSRQIATCFETRLIVHPENRGKWEMLQSLLKQSDNYDWVVLADAGVVWPEDFLLTSMQYLHAEDLIGLAPAYEPLTGGLLSKIHWRLERALKSLENLSGGPVSVHGATVVYRTSFLREVLPTLQGKRWTNDDVVIPLLLRTSQPERRLLYLPKLCVHDSAVEFDPRAEQARRHRMMRGNLEWIRDFIPFCFRRNTVPAVVCLRRVFRVFWGYWALAFVSGVALLGLTLLTNRAGELAIAALLGAMMLLYLSPRPPAKKIRAALQASLLGPLQIFQPFSSAGVRWR